MRVTTIGSGYKTTHTTSLWLLGVTATNRLPPIPIVVTKPPPKWLCNHFTNHLYETRPRAGFLALGGRK